jgi:hypothetical protein
MSLIRRVTFQISEIKQSKFVPASKWSTSRPARFSPVHEPKYPQNRKMGGPQNRSERFEQQKNPLTLPAIEPRTVHHVS